MAVFDVVSYLDEKTHDFAWHGRKDLLAAFGFDGAMAAAAPSAGIDDFGGEFLPVRMKFQFTVWGRRHCDFEGMAFEQNGKRVGSGLDGVDGDGPAIQRHAPSDTIAFEFDHASFFSGRQCELDFVFHGRRSSCSRRPSSFHREGWSVKNAG